MPRIQTDAASNHTMNIKKKAMDPDVDQGPSRFIKPIPVSFCMIQDLKGLLLDVRREMLSTRVG